MQAAGVMDTSQTATLFDRQYEYDNASQIESVTEPGKVRNFSYDFVNRLTGMTSPTEPAESYNFDKVGNRTASHRSANYGYETGQFNRVNSTDTAGYVYDANGNIRMKAEGKELWRYQWDFDNRLVSASTRKQTVRYKYDALGRRIQRFIVGGKENTKFIYDGADVIADDNSGTLTKYINGPGVDNKLRMQTGGDVRYFIADHLGSTNALTDASGNVTSSASYDSFGNATGNLATRYKFTGREYDDFTGLHYYRARWYDGNLGRFISEDPIGFAGGDVNLYGYVGNGPLGAVDPFGTISDDALLKLAPHDLGMGYRARIDRFNGPEGFEIHVYSPKVNRIGAQAEVGIVNGRNGWIAKHGFPSVPPEGLPQPVLNKLNGLNVDVLRQYELIPPKGSANIQGGRYLFPGRSIFGTMGRTVLYLGIVEGLLIDYGTYFRAESCGRTFGEQFAEDNRNYRYIMTPLGLLPNPSYIEEIY
ncbi:MAG: RHS domain-containing protein [Acidobacteria bacterium]|nr:RHS domain-containing protein [Acidobacteriota bacterium]